MSAAARSGFGRLLTLCNVALALVLAGSFLMQMRDLDHLSIKTHDEVFHAIVARNLLSHPLVPTLVEQPFLSFDDRDWQANHIWLHKPPLALWQIAVSFAIGGVDTLSLRMPSAIEATAAVLLTFLIGQELLNGLAGLIAAALQAFNPVLVMLVHGNLFSDHVDVTLLFWTELAIFFLARAIRTGRRSDAILCGGAQGLAFLAKTYPALIVTGVALVAWLLPMTRLGQSNGSRVTGRSVLWILAGTLLTALPWNLYAAIRFPHEFAYENLTILAHVNQNIEGFGAPWDRLLFGYWISTFYVYYPAILTAAITLGFIAFRQRNTRLWIVLAWGLGVLIPNLLATSKPPVATLTGWPPMWLLLGYLITRASAGEAWALGAWLASMVLALFITSRSIPTAGFGAGEPGFASIMQQNWWVTWQTLAALGATALAAWTAAGRRWPRPAPIALTSLAAAAMLLLAVRWWKGDYARGYLSVAWEATTASPTDTDFAAVGRYAARLPPNAAFIVDEHVPLENKVIEFWSDRSCYGLYGRDWRVLRQQLSAAGALPYLVSTEAIPGLPPVYASAPERCVVYACTAAAVEAAQKIGGASLDTGRPDY